MSKTKVALRAGAVVVMGVIGLFNQSEASAAMCSPENCLTYCPSQPGVWCENHGCGESVAGCYSTGCSHFYNVHCNKVQE